MPGQKTMKGAGNSLLIAYAEDHAVVRQGIIALLCADSDIEVTIEAADGLQLITQLRMAATLPDICLIDIHMPHMDGFESIAVIKREWPDMKVLVLTALTEEIYILRMIRAGANGFLLKGADIAEIRKALFAVAASGKYYSGAFSRYLHNAMEDKLVKIPVLTQKELEVLRLSVSDLSYPEIAATLNASVRSIQGIRDNLFKKMEVHNRASLVVKAIKMGFLTLQEVATS
ncbi:response regulator transcription factor [Taibaiella koreensis]|uniref:response regulator transcription factor n=1 Tax=Taibaiella koreensis TaxID=1268548 RepID=UPI000E59F5DA|nr:response regulator transcription factor [Taibaiella koreensis]